MKVICLRWDYLENRYGRVKANIDYMESLPEEDEGREHLVDKKIELLEIEDAMNRLRKQEKDNGKE